METGVYLWYPKVYIGNDVQTQNLVNFAQDAGSIANLWYLYPEHKLHYGTIFTAKIACSLDFQTFPFDSHTCLMNVNNWIGANHRIVFGKPKIYTNDGFYTEGKEIGGYEFELKTDGRLDYDFKFESLPSSTFIDSGFEYALAQVKINFKRTEKSRTEIFEGYHLPTAIFAILSLLSFFIQPDSVPGRMGMLIMLDLIQSNSYIAVKAPPKRGFSTLEIWFVGIQVPILLAIFEYGVLLAMKKFRAKQQEELFKFIDLCTLCVSIIYLLTFNALYWLVLAR